MRCGSRRARASCGGFTYLVMLFALAIFGLGLSALGESWSAASQRDKEQELIEIGAAYVKAIGAYYMRSPGAGKAYPMHLEDLLADTRFVGTERYLRRLYRDPFGKGAGWGLIRAADGGIIGIYSLSEQAVLHKGGLAIPGGAALAGTRYVDWKFQFQEPR